MNLSNEPIQAIKCFQENENSVYILLETTKVKIWLPKKGVWGDFFNTKEEAINFGIKKCEILSKSKNKYIQDHSKKMSVYLSKEN